MPIQVRIALNEDTIDTYHIGRISRNGMDEDSVNEYAVVNQHPEPTNNEWDAAPRFEHRYGDSAATLVLKAVNRHQQYLSELIEKEVSTPLTSQLPPLHVVSLSRQDVANVKASERCNYKSPRMHAPCRLNYGHGRSHQS